MPLTDSLDQLTLLLRSSHSVITCETVEEERFRVLARHATFNLNSPGSNQIQQVPFFEWSIVGGMARNGQLPIPDTTEPVDCLRFLRETPEPAVFLLNDFVVHLQGPTLIRLFREVAVALARKGSSVLLCAPKVDLPEEIRHLAVPFQLQLPTPAELQSMLNSVLDPLLKSRSIKIQISPDETKALLQSLSGLTLQQAKQSITYAVLEEGALNVNGIAKILERKAQLVRDGGILDFFPLDHEHAEVGGFSGMKLWLNTIRIAFSEEAHRLHLAAPRGVLLVGIPGCGKSLCAKMVASQWNQPLLRLDAARLFDKYIGESERNFQKATRVAEAMAPCVFWIDEIEKMIGASSGGSDDGGVSQRLLGAFLTWLQEKQKEVFLVATANDTSRLPPELLRKGRFDEIFFVDLPQSKDREEIFKLQLKSHEQNISNFDLGALAGASEGFSGAEIEQIVSTSLLKGLRDKVSLSTASLLLECQTLIPLSKTRASDIANLRELARGRFKSAS